MIKQNKTQGQRVIMYSKEISNLPASVDDNNHLPLMEEDALFPRVFADNKVPLKVAIMRKIKAFQEFDIGTALAGVEWKYGRGLLELVHYDYSVDTAVGECSEERLKKKMIRGRAYCQTRGTFRQYLVTGVNIRDGEPFLVGYFIDQPSQVRQIHKFYVCLSFQNPQIYCRNVLQAQAIRERLLGMARFNFYIDNMDLQGAQEMPKQVLNEITKLIGVQFLHREGFQEISTHFKRTMNELLFAHTVLSDPAITVEKIVVREKRKVNHFKPKNRTMTLVKDGKKFKLTLKSLKTKIEEVQAKTIFFRVEVVELMQHIKAKLQQIYNYPIFDLKQQLHVLDRFTGDNLLMVGYFQHFLEQQVAVHIGEMVRKELLRHSQGWFKLYEVDKNTYLLSKLRRLFIFIEQNIKSVVKSHIQAELVRYCQVFGKRVPISVNFLSFSDCSLTFPHSHCHPVHYPPLLVISCNIGVNNFEMTIKKERIEELLNKNISAIFKRLKFVNSPQNRALVEIYSIFKDEYGIDVEVPGEESGVEEGGVKVNEHQFSWIAQEYRELRSIFKKSVNTLGIIEEKLMKISVEINLTEIIRDSTLDMPLPQIIEKIKHFNALYSKLDDYFPGTGIDFGLYFIDYKPAKDQLKELIEKKVGVYKMQLIKEYQVSSQRIQRQLQQLVAQIHRKPSNIYQLVKQREKLQSLEEMIDSCNVAHQVYLFNLCENYECLLGRADMDRRWTNTQRVSSIFSIRESKEREYGEIKKGIVQHIRKQKDEIFEVLGLFRITLDNIKENSKRELYAQNYGKLSHLNEQYLKIKSQLQDIRYKQTHLSLPPINFQLFLRIQQDFQLLFTLWQVVYKWETNRAIWYFCRFGEFEIDRPESLITEMLGNLKRVEKGKGVQGQQLGVIAGQVKKEIEFLQDKHLRLLKLLKKEGFSRKHLEKVGIYIEGEIEDLTLQRALDLNFLEMIEQIEAVSNDAWNEFYLQQTLNRVQSQLISLKYQTIFYLDKKGNEIPLVNNYLSLDEKLQQVILDLQSVQFNPMKGQFQRRINDLLEKSLYISKSLQNCEMFQKRFVEVHPIFDSTDVVKQLPQENRMFTKVMRNWVEMLKYFGRIVSVYDSCNGQNIAEKVAFMLGNLEKVKVGLANYLQKKRQGFSRFYLLTDQELYELFASTNDIAVLSRHISKLFHSVNRLIYDGEMINAVVGLETVLQLRETVRYKGQNLEEWLSRLERSIRGELAVHVGILLAGDKGWVKMLGSECSQVLLMCYEIEKTQQIVDMRELEKLEQNERNFIRKLVDIKKNTLLTIAESVNLGSLLVLALYFSEKVAFLRSNNITDPDNFQLKKMMKITYKQEQIRITSFETEIGYGFEYLGLVKRLVLTNLTERMQLIYLSAIRYSLGGSAIGPAGTGKSETTKDIARICGKNCIIYNCSESLGFEIMVRILKGMAVTGLWICLDEFNRLHYQVLNMLSQQLSILFKYKAMGMRLNVQYDRQIINFKPDFHLCITYNPTYIDRLSIPNSVQRQFRIVAMVNCDKKMICKLLFYSKGFKEADQLSEKLNRVFEYCQEVWWSFKLYDFGLRTLISVIELSGMLFKGKGKGDEEVNEAIRILVYPRLSENHRQMLKDYSRKIFENAIHLPTQNTIDSYVTQIHNILTVRLGIILLGDIFSNKGTTMRMVEEQFPQYRIEEIHINTLTIEQIYGATDSTTRIFKDGYLTKKIREYISANPKENLVIYIRGVIFSQWIENLNSVLDNTRSLSLPSGEILWIPDKVKFIINCAHLEYASPATISRSCIVSYKAKTAKELIKGDKEKEALRLRVYDQYEVIINEVRPFLAYELDERLIIHWINQYLEKGKLPFSCEAFMHALALVLEGMLDDKAKKMLNHTIKSYLSFDGQIFDNYWDGKQWRPFNEIILNPSLNDSLQIGDIIIRNKKYRNIFYINKTFFQGKGGLSNLLLLIGPQNIGKSSTISAIYSSMDKKQIKYSSVNLTRKFRNTELHSALQGMLHKKSNKRKGMIHGKELFILLDDLHLPQENRYRFKNTVELLTLLLVKKGCYNYNHLEFQFLEDLYLIGNYNLEKRHLRLGKEFLKHVLPVFLKGYGEEEIVDIFHELTKQMFGNENYVNVYLENAEILGKNVKQIIEVSSEYLPSFLCFEFIHFRKIITSVLLWKTQESTERKDIITDLFVYESERVLLSRATNPQMKDKLKALIRNQFRREREGEVLFHGFQKSQNGTGIERQQCNRVTDFDEFMREVEYICDQYILSSDNPKNSFVIFPELCLFVCRISRALSLKKGNISIVGLPKSGKKVMVELCNYLLHGRIYKITDKYEQKTWYQVIRNSTKQSFLNKLPSILLIQHNQLKQQTQKQELNTLLKTFFLPQVYSQADHQELTYLFQNQLIKTHQAVNKQNTLKLFVNYLQHNFHIFLLFNPMIADFKENILFYPAIAKETEFYWIDEWPREALLMIATQAIVDQEIDPYLNLLPEIHSICKKETLSKTKIPYWEGLYLDFLKIFDKMHNQRRLYLQNKQNILNKSFAIIKETQLKLQSTRDQIKRLQPAILILQKQTIKTIKSLNIQKSNAQSVNEQLQKKEIQCEKVIGEANAVKMKLQITNARVEQQLKKAWQNVYLVKQNHIAQIKSLMNPSDFIKIVITAIVIILNEGEYEIIRNRSQDGLSYQQNYFQTGKRYILSKDSKNITKMLTEYNKEKLTKNKVALVEEKCLNHPRWNIVEAKNANKAVFYFFLWVEAVVKYFKLFQETIPLRGELAKTTAIYEEKSKEIQIVKKELDIYEKKITDLTNNHKEKTFKLTQYTNQIKLYQKMLNRGYEILKEIETEKVKWLQYEQQIHETFRQNIGNCILSSVLIVYVSPHTNEMRSHIMNLIRNTLLSKELTFNKDNIYWLMENQEAIILRELGIYEDQYILNNLKIIEKTEKISFIIDPQEEGIKYMKERYRTQGVMFVYKIDIKHKSFRKTLQKSIIEGFVIFVQINGLDLPYLIEFLINPQFKKNESNGNLQILLDDKLLTVNPKFKVYLFTTNTKEEYSIDLISKVTTINFSITPHQLQENLVSLILSIQYPQENEQLQELNKGNIKDNIQLKAIENKILNIFANMENCEDILKTEDLLTILSTSNRLYNQIQIRIAQSNTKRKSLKTRRDHFLKKAEKTSRLYFQIQKLSSLSSYYQYSFSWFINLFKDNLNNFTDVLSIQLAKGLPLDQKIIAPLIIAESEFTKIPFYKLFNQRTEESQFLQERYRLKVSKVRLSRIIGNIKEAGIENLDRFVKDFPEKIQPILTAEIQDILSTIPDEFSTLEFFDKILIINCFRPDCTLKLLKDWLNINLGTTFKFQPAKLMEQSSFHKPFLIFQNSTALTSASSLISKIFDTYYLQTGKSVCYINSNHCSLSRIKMLLESGLLNDQWVVLEGLGEYYSELNEMIINLMEQGDFKRKEMFRLWLIINEYQLKNVRQKLIKMSNKIIFEEEIEITKKMCSFFMSQSEKLTNLSNGIQLNKKKYILHQLCLFHFMLSEKCKYKQKQWNTAIYFSLQDLQMSIKYLYTTSPSQLKKLYPNIITNIIYGGKITQQEDIRTISLHIEEVMRNMVLDRNVFWQTVWADDKFPKNEQEYEMYLRSVFSKGSSPFRNVAEQYGINSFVVNFIKQKQYKKISQFYNKSKEVMNQNESLIRCKERLREMKRVIDRKLSIVNMQIEVHKRNSFYNYLVDQQQIYMRRMTEIQREMDYYLQADNLFNEKQRKWCSEIISNKIPEQWNISTIRSLDSWLNIFLEGLQFIFKINYEDFNHSQEIAQKSVKRVYSLEFTQHFPTFCQQIYVINKCSSDTHCLFWELEKLDLVNSNVGVRVEHWYIWNALFQGQVKLLNEGTIEVNYYSPLPRGILSVMHRQQVKKIQNYSEILVYQSTFEHGDNPIPIGKIYMPVEKTSDKEWLKRMRVHLTLTI